LTLPCRLLIIGNVLTYRFRPNRLACMALAPRETDFLWPDPKRGPWWVKIWWRLQHGVPVPVGLSLKSWVEDEEAGTSGPHNYLPGPRDDVALPQVDGKLLRSMPFGRMLADSRLQLLERLRHRVDDSRWPQAWRDALAEWRQRVQPELDAVERGRRGGRDLGDDHYRHVAQVYAQAVQAGRPPTVAVAEQFQVEKSSAAKKVARARERGFLPPTTRGRIGRLTGEV
jgi:hypothetical protein